MSEPIYKVITLSIHGNSPLKREVSHEMFGWYHHLGAAALAVEQNALDMQDCAFNYALISRSYQGGYGLNDEEIQWYKWDYTDEKWEMCGFFLTVFMTKCSSPCNFANSSCGI